jgi:hypothetical protein
MAFMSILNMMRKRKSHKPQATSHKPQALIFFFVWWAPPTSSSLILNLWVGPAHKLFSNRDKMSHDPRTVMRQIVTCDNYFLDVTFQQHCCHTTTGCANQRTLKQHALFYCINNNIL